MPVYRYQAASLDGKVTKGELNFADEAHLRQKLSDDKLYLLSYEEKGGIESLHRQLKASELADFSRQLGAMLKAGVPLIKAMGILVQRESKPRIKKAYQQLYNSLQGGFSLSEGMRVQEDFPELLINAISASEQSGQMDKTCFRMADHYEKEHRLEGKIRSASFYPCFLLGVTVVVVIIIFQFVLPKFFTIFEGLDLPVVTQVVMRFSTWLSANWLLLLILVLLLVFSLTVAIRIPSIRLALDKLKLRLPIIGKLLQTIYTARFARTLSSLYSSGLTIVNALQNTRNTVGNTYIASQFDAVVQAVRSGQLLSDSIRMVDGFDPKLISTINIGEEAGNLDYMLETMAEAFDYDAEQATSKMVALIEPIMIIVMAIVICVIVMSVLLPILNLYNSIGSGYGSF